MHDITSSKLLIISPPSREKGSNIRCFLIFFERKAYRDSELPDIIISNINRKIPRVGSVAKE